MCKKAKEFESESFSNSSSFFIGNKDNIPSEFPSLDLVKMQISDEFKEEDNKENDFKNNKINDNNQENNNQENQIEFNILDDNQNNNNNINQDNEVAKILELFKILEHKI